METGTAIQARGKINPDCSVGDELAVAAQGSPLKVTPLFLQALTVPMFSLSLQ